MPRINFKLMKHEAKIPQYAHNDDAGFDIFSSIKTVVKPGEFAGIPTGVSAEIPSGYFVSFRGKSGLAIKKGINILGGVIDSGYKGEWVVILINLGKTNYKIESGDKIAQGIVHKKEKVILGKTNKLSKSARGAKGFGSTGK